MSQDINRILKDWPYDPQQVSARRIVGDDGKDKLQLRLDMGLLQMESDGHPAGMKPHGHENHLAYYRHLRDIHVGQTGTDDEFVLDEQACELLRAEAVMYYHRYLAEFILEDYEAVVRDTQQNLDAMDFCAAFADDESARLAMEQYRPHVIMMRTRADGLLAMRDNRPKTALAAVRKGMSEIRQCYRDCPEDEDVFDGGELAMLRDLAREISRRIPADPVARLRRQLARAVKEERYEEAAHLRDRLRHLAGHEQHPKT